MSEQHIIKTYELAREKYAELGVDTDAALQKLADFPVSIHCWQGDDVGGFENASGGLTGGIQATAIAVMTAAGSSGIASVTIVNAGAGYLTSPNFWIIPQPASYQGGPAGGVAAGALPAPGLVYPSNAVAGNQNTSATGAQLTSAALTGSGTLLGVHMINSGGGYTGAATVTFTGGAGGVAVTSVVAVTANANSLCLVQPRVQ